MYSTGVGKLSKTSLLYIARFDFPILVNIYTKVPCFQIAPFTFNLTESERYVEFPDYSVFEITQGKETVRFLIGVVDTVTVTCGSQSSINFLEFLWDNTLIFAILMCVIVCVPLVSPTVLHLRHRRATSVGWTQSSLCTPCFLNYI